MSSVLIIIIIPDQQCEIEVAEKEKLARKYSRKKLKKGLSITIENDEEDENDTNSLENNNFRLSKVGLSYLEIPDATWQKSFNGKYWHISFPVDLEDSDIVIQYFKSRGIGLHLNSSIGIIPFTLFCFNEESAKLEEEPEIELDDKTRELHNFKENKNKFLKSVTARLTVAQIVSSVRDSATLTFDFLCYLIFASWIAAMGLLDNSVVSLVASMLVSPMMGPVMAMTFGTIIKDRSLRNMGIKNIFVCLMGTISFGFLFGMIALNFTQSWTDSLGSNNTYTWPTDMMRERGLVRITWVAISLLSGNDASLVGVAISVSLLPPAVNAGLLWAFSLLKLLYSFGESGKVMTQFQSHFNHSNLIELPQALVPLENYTTVYSDNMALEALYLGMLSLCLSLINIANIIIGALLLLKIKEIVPLSNLSPVSRRFFQEDIKIAREYNQRSETKNLSEDVLREYATIHGYDSEQFMKPEQRAAQLQALNDIAEDVEADQVFQTVTRSVHNTDNNLARRLSQSLFVNQNNGRWGRRQTSAAIFNHQPPTIIVSDALNPRRPSYVHLASHNRLRISTALKNNLNEMNDNLSSTKTCPGYINKAFSFNENDINNYNERKGSDSSVVKLDLETITRFNDKSTPPPSPKMNGTGG
ncbi:hypothetical protein DERF_001661 [Dermatophagoides farinae]|uniref:Uncharacterized protein n=1 Tax=Dermatophagoides farinae TaxID=6954 RepID=A0A922IE57_DERFA|nr:hypothetical protein DERF_001661 [Dermatophagoides farinae]